MVAGIGVGLSCGANFWLIIVDRSIAVKFPMKHFIWIRKRRAKVALVAIWCLQTILLLSLNVLLTAINLMINMFGGMNVAC